MNLTLRTDAGCTEAVIDDNCGFSKFQQIADVLTDKMKIVFTGKVDNFDSMDWTFNYKGHSLILHFNIYNGISILARKSLVKENKAVIELARTLKEKYYY